MSGVTRRVHGDATHCNDSIRDIFDETALQLVPSLVENIGPFCPGRARLNDIAAGTAELFR